MDEALIALAKKWWSQLPDAEKNQTIWRILASFGEYLRSHDSKSAT